MDHTTKSMIRSNELGPTTEPGLPGTKIKFGRGIVHVLRCIECGFESMIPQRFSTHLPCAIKLDSYVVYTCSQCSACSTSQSLMQEHGELCHTDQSFVIEKRVEQFIKPSVVTETDMTGATSPNTSVAMEQRSDSLPEITATEAASSDVIPVTMDLSKDSKSQLPNLENPMNLKPRTPFPNANTRNQSQARSGEPTPDLATMNSFVDLMNIFSTTMGTNVPDQRKMSDQRLNSDLDSPETNKGNSTITCPICHKNWMNGTTGNEHNLEELAKHLALVHLLPFPAILNCLSVIALGSAHQPGPSLLNATNGSRSLTNSITPESSAMLQDFRTPVTIQNAVGARSGSECSEWTERGTISSTEKQNTSTDSNNSSATGFRTLKRDYPNNESQPERNKWRERNSKETPKNPRSPSKTYDCPHCSRNCFSVPQLQQHILQTHSEELAAMNNPSHWTFPPTASAFLPGFWPNTRRTGQTFRGDSQPHEISKQPGSDDQTKATTTAVPFPPSSSAIGTSPFDQPTIPSPIVNWHLAAAAAAATAAAFGMPFPMTNNLGSMIIRSPGQPYSVNPVDSCKINTTATSCSEPKRPKLHSSEMRSIGPPSVTNGIQTSVNCPLPLLMPNSDTTNVNGTNALVLETLKLTNPLWGPQNSSSSLSSFSMPKFPDIPNPALLKSETIPSYPTLVPAFPFCDSVSILPSLYASAQQRIAGTDALGNVTTNSPSLNINNAPSWNDEFSNAYTERRSDTNNDMFWPNPSPRSNRLDHFSAEHLGLSSDPNSGSLGMYPHINHPKSPDTPGKLGREVKKAPTNLTTPSSPGRSTSSTVANLTTLTTPSLTTVTSKSMSHGTGTTNVTPISAQGNSCAENQTVSANGLVHNTLRKTRSDMKVIHRYLVHVKHDTRDIHQIPYYELDQYIQDFVLTAKKKDGHEYEPESLKAFVHSLERHLKHHDYPHSVLKGSAFTGTRAVLNQRLNELRALSRSGGSTHLPYASAFGPNKRLLTDPGLDTTGSGGHTTGGLNKRSQTAAKSMPAGALIQAGLLGKDNPQAVLNSLWLINRTQFNIGGTQRHRNLVWGQFQLVTDDLGVKAIKFTPLFESAEVRYCRGYGGGKNTAADYNNGHSVPGMPTLSGSGLSKRQPLPFSCVELFELYANLRPTEACGVSEPFYLCPETSWEHTGSWFKTSAAGSQLLSRIPRMLGLKPSREPPASVNPSNSDSREVSGPELMRDPSFSNEDRNASLTQSASLLPKYLMDQTLPDSPAGSGLPVTHSTLGPNLFNLFPFMFGCATDANSPSLLPHPYMTPTTAYANLMANNPLTNYSARFDLEKEKGLNLTSVPGASGANDLIRADRLDLRQSKLSPNRSNVQSPRSQPAPSSDGTPSPTDAENLSLSDMSPRLQRTAMGTRSVTPTSASKNRCSLVHNMSSSSRKNSDSSHESIKMEEEGILCARDLSEDSSNEQSDEVKHPPSSTDSESEPTHQSVHNKSDCAQVCSSNDSMHLTHSSSLLCDN
ncbi:hypothetical protein D915_004861 [Fasciola hepatica]|uniref:C2H2-type domain-containing protein n=1 Tax=Fasciola hepatica TaxID=6192 RepID=A0A4E0S182_FASHE|nr:hypothetical protein D915_004861 [Fasciola hepatica]